MAISATRPTLAVSALGVAVVGSLFLAGCSRGHAEDDLKAQVAQLQSENADLQTKLKRAQDDLKAATQQPVEEVTDDAQDAPDALTPPAPDQNGGSTPDGSAPPHGN